MTPDRTVTKDVETMAGVVTRDMVAVQLRRGRTVNKIVMTMT